MPAGIGGLSGVARLGPRGPWLFVSDNRVTPRWYRAGLTLGAGSVSMNVEPPVAASRPRDADGALRRLDLEAVAALPGGDLLVASEGNRQDGERHPGSVMRYHADGRYRGAVPLPKRFLPSGEATGLRDGLGFEGLAVSADGSRGWLLSEAPAWQDGEPAGVTSGSRTRLLELVADADQAAGFRPGRELVYEIEPSGLPVGLGRAATLASQGPVAVTYLPGGELLVMERAFLYDADLGQSANVIRIFAIDPDGADDVSGVASLLGVPDARPVTKRLLVDLADLAPGLDPRLRTLANFEGMAPGPPTPDGRPTLILVSDDNFADSQAMAIIVLVLAH